MYVLSEKPSPQSLPFVDIYVYTPLYNIISGERLDFDLNWFILIFIVLKPIKMLHSQNHTVPYVLNGILRPIYGTFPYEIGTKFQIPLTQ